MNKNHRSVICAVRMGIGLRRLPVSCPAGMSNTAGTRHSGTAVRLFHQSFQASFGLHNGDLVCHFIAHRNTC